jgi:uncharacterized membrane protein
MESLTAAGCTEDMNITSLTTVLAALGSAAFGGVLFGFSTLVMPGLDASPAPAAISTMQQINKVAPKSLLAVDMVVTLLLCLAVGVLALLRMRGDESRLGAGLVLLGCLLYVASFAITAAYHIPHNDAFASVAAHGPNAAQAWHDYAHPWELWNHVRAACALGGSAAMILGLLARGAA